MYLIKVEMDRREARSLMADCQKMHQFVTELFGSDRQSAQILYRTNLVQNRFCIYLYARTKVTVIPEYCEIQQRDITPWLEHMEAGQLWSFDLIAAPTKKVGAEGRKNSQRRVLREPAERRFWMERKAAMSGFEILQAEELEQIHVSGKHKAARGSVMYHDAYHYRGVLRITDDKVFRETIQNGIGSGKAYGFGMMMVKGL